VCVFVCIFFSVCVSYHLVQLICNVLTEILIIKIIVLL